MKRFAVGWVLMALGCQLPPPRDAEAELDGLRADGPSIGALDGCFGNTESMFSPDDQRVMLLSGCGVDLIEDGEQRRLQEGVADAAVFSPVGDRIAVAATVGKTPLAWVSTGDERTKLVLEEGERVVSLRFTPDGAQVIARIVQHERKAEDVVMFDAATGAVTDRASGATGCDRSTAVSDDGTLVLRTTALAQEEQQSGCLIYPVITQLSLEVAHRPSSVTLMRRSFTTKLDGALNKLCPMHLEVSPDGKHGLYYAESYTLRILDFENDAIREITYPASYRRARFTPDGHSILLWHEQQATLISLDGQTRWTRDLPLPHSTGSSHRRESFSADGSRVLLPLNIRGSVALDLRTGTVLHAHDARSGVVVGINSAGDRLLTRRFGGTNALHFMHL